MSVCRYCLLLAPMLVFLMAATPAPETASRPRAADDLQRNRDLLQKWKSEPEHHARLQRDLGAFWALPEAQRVQLRQLDHDLHQLDAPTQKRLWRVAERYASWLDSLPEDVRRRIEETRDPQERLQRIRALRSRQWVETLPRKVREHLEKMPENERQAEITRLREQERQQRLLWKRPVNAGPRPRQPARPADLPPEGRNFLDKHLLPHLTAEEKRQYQAALGHYPEFPQTVKELARRHPVLPPLPNRPIVRFDDLPEKARSEAGSKPSWERRVEVWQRLRRVEGKWPEWALTFHSLLSAEQRKHMPPLGASRPEDFPAEVHEFIKKTLKPTVTAREWKDLHALQGKWPDYPLTLLRLGEKHNLTVPGMSLPAADW